MGSSRAVRASLVLAFVLVTGSAFAQASMVPEWFVREGAVLSGSREGTIADAASITIASPPPADALPHALLLCHVATSDTGPHGRWDSFADPDLRIQLHAGRFRSTAWGPENSMQADVSFAGVPLRRGDRIEVAVWDRDVTGDERIDTVRTTFAGSFPIALDHDATHVSCALGDAVRAEAAASVAFTRAEPIVARVEAAHPTLVEAGLGRPSADEGAASTDVALGMAYAGLADPRGVALRDRLHEADVAFERAIGALVTQTIASGGDTASIAGGPTVHLEGVLTSRAAIRRAYPTAPDPIACVVEISVAPMPSDLTIGLGAPDAIDTHGSVISSLDLARHATDPTRIGISFAMRLRRVVLRVGPAGRSLLVVR